MMIRKLVSTMVAAAALATTMTPVAAVAHEHDSGRDGYGWHGEERHHDEGRDWDHREHRDYDRYDRHDGRGYDRRGYYGRGYSSYYGAPAYYAQPGYTQEYYAQPSYYAQPGYARGYDQRAYWGRPEYRTRCRNDGATGTILGAIAGGLIGNGVAGYGDRTLGTVIGAGGGALAGRAIDRGC